MGSFDLTCAVSGLPIHAGANVRYILLQQNPYLGPRGVTSKACHADDVWMPRTPPLFAKYNDYGSIERYDEKSIAAWTIVEGLRHDMLEQGVGRNTFHDVATHRRMSLASTLRAVQEDRLAVEMLYAEDKDRRKESPDLYGPKAIAQALILDSVWEALLARSLDWFLKLRVDLMQAWINIRAPEDVERATGFVIMPIRDAVPYTLLYGSHFALAAQEHAFGEHKYWSAETIALFVEHCAELAAVERAFLEIRYWWRPSYICGQQWDDAKAHSTWFHTLSKIADSMVKKDEED